MTDNTEALPPLPEPTLDETLARWQRIAVRKDWLTLAADLASARAALAQAEPDEKAIDELGMHSAAVKLVQQLGYLWAGGEWRPAAQAEPQEPLTDEIAEAFFDAFQNDRRILGDFEAFVGTLRDATAQAEPVAPFLFIAMDDEKRAHLTWCADEAAVREAVKDAMFWLPNGEELNAEHTEQLDGSVAELLESGALIFEGDAPLYLFYMGSAVQKEQL